MIMSMLLFFPYVASSPIYDDASLSLLPGGTILSFCVNSSLVIASTCSSSTTIWQPQVLSSRPSSTCTLKDINNEEDEVYLLYAPSS